MLAPAFQDATVGRTHMNTPTSDKPVVSVIIPAYNAEQTLSETVQSVLGQSFSDLEAIIVDDASADHTLALAHEFADTDRRIRVLTRPNGGTGAARNVALREARGRFFALLDSDDVWMPSYLADQLRVFDQFPDVDIVTVNAINLGGDKSGQPLWPSGSWLAPLALIDMIEREDAVCIMSIFRRQVYETIGGFAERSKGHDDRVLFKGNEDYHFWIRAACSGFRFLANHTPACYYRRRPDSLSADEGQMLAGIITVLKEARTMCAGLPLELSALDRQIERFDCELMLSDLRKALIKRDVAGASRQFNRIAEERRSRMWQLLAACWRQWPEPLIWVYELRRALRSRIQT
jgi:glycosyltransferase involved in cell wall biosynthesis